MFQEDKPGPPKVGCLCRRAEKSLKSVDKKKNCLYSENMNNETKIYIWHIGVALVPRRKKQQKQNKEHRKTNDLIWKEILGNTLDAHFHYRYFGMNKNVDCHSGNLSEYSTPLLFCGSTFADSLYRSLRMYSPSNILHQRIKKK